jgi:hypothetical protein
MATISDAYKDFARREYARLHRLIGAIDIEKAELNAAVQAVEDRFTDDQAGYVSAVNTAAGQTLTMQQLRLVFIAWVIVKAKIVLDAYKAAL